jgi:YkoY family integral membrane protein
VWGLQTADIITILGALATLVVLEGLLSADNALVLAVMVRHLPRGQQKRALRYGIWGAFIFRFIAVVCAKFLLYYWQLKVVGGLYLLYLAVSRLWSGEASAPPAEEPPAPHGGPEPHAPPQTPAPPFARRKLSSGFWRTVIGVEIADIAFSIDSILAAVAMADSLPARFDEIQVWLLSLKLWVVYIGGVLGIITMRFVAGLFLIALRRFPNLAVGAYVLVAWIGLELLGSGFNSALHPPAINGHPRAPAVWVGALPAWVQALHLEMPTWFFWAGMGLIAVLSMLFQPRAHHPSHAEAESQVGTR